MRISLFLFIFKINRIKKNASVKNNNKAIRFRIKGPVGTNLTPISNIIIYAQNKSKNIQIIAYRTLLSFMAKYSNFLKNKLVKIPIKHDIIETTVSNNT